ncbi:ly6/PLAUR domain-containing protein 6-like isoform X1 [Branchiostoma floridae x Branchiostoma japonicum]
MEIRVDVTSYSFLVAVISHLLQMAYGQDIKWDAAYTPSSTPFPGSMKCWTCEEASDNYNCNRWAPDVYCPQGTKYCHTLHRMNGEGGSVMVRKKCAAMEDCTPNTVGCSINTDGSMVCIACCEGNICNPEVPTNHTTAIFATITPYDVGSSSHFNPSVQVLLVTLLAAVLFRHL